MNKYTVLLLFLFAIILPLNSQQTNTVLLSGIITDETTKQPIGVDITLQDSEGKKSYAKSDPVRGSYQFVINNGGKYEITLNSNSIIRKSFEIEIPKVNKYTEINHNYSVTPIKEGNQIMSFTGFSRSKSDLSTEGKQYLDELFNVLKLNRFFNIELTVNANDLKEELMKKPAKQRKNMDAQVNTLLNSRKDAIQKYVDSWGSHKNRINIVEDTKTASSINDVIVLISKVNSMGLD